MTIDGTDYRILQKGAARKGNAFGSFKYAGKSALRYKLRVDILAGNLIWVSGPYPAGKYTDIAIYNSVLANCLEPGERVGVEADNGYVGRPDKIKCPNNDCNPAENGVMQGIARSRHETLNGQLKAWGILGNIPPRHQRARDGFLRMCRHHAAIRRKRRASVRSGVWRRVTR